MLSLHTTATLSVTTVWLVQEEALEESGWKLVHGDVFRPPIYRRLLVALTGAGIQIFMSTFVVIGKHCLVQRSR